MKTSRVILLGVVVLGLAAMSVHYYQVFSFLTPEQCDRLSIRSSQGHRWDWWEGCQVRTPFGQWIPVRDTLDRWFEGRP